MIEPVRSIKKPVFAIALQPVCIVYRSEKLLLFYKRSSLQCTLAVLHSVAGGLPCARAAAADSGIWVVSAGWQGASQANRAVRRRARLWAQFSKRKEIACAACALMK